MPCCTEHSMHPLNPSTDLRDWARAHPRLEWHQLFQDLPGEIYDLKHASQQRNRKNFNVVLAAIIANVQVLQAALHTTDTAHADWDLVSSSWVWGQAYTTSSAPMRLTLALWHYLALHAQELRSVWGTEDAHALSVANTLKDRLGFALIHKPSHDTWDMPPLSLPSFSRHRADRSRILPRCELAQFQRRALLSHPGEIALHRALTGHIVGALTDNALWIVPPDGDDSYDAWYSLPPWEDETSTIILLKNDRVVAVRNASRLKNVKTRISLTSNFLPSAINFC